MLFYIYKLDQLFVSNIYNIINWLINNELVTNLTVILHQTYLIYVAELEPKN